ncbi:HIRA-interacting protein 3 isoform X3 [Nerophis ophidion]|uniref:HIRA-interacting protein 3 isoform X3 n=1 Tax=Nerophis ophidion TaxID=159077 RepID=UPI002AE0AD44|nr:HIRA-interacting protein 3 isoform X3 [Nerophis ophidion]
MSPARELTTIRSFVRGQLRDEKDLSLLTLRLLKRRYLALVGGECLSPSAKGLLKQVVEEELIKMQDVTKSGSESETKEDTPNERKREREKHSASESECEVESKQKKSRRYVNSVPAESEDKEECSEDSVASEEEEEETKTRAGDAKQEITNAEHQDDSEDDEVVAELKSNTPKTKTDHSKEDEDESDSDQSDTQNASDGSKKDQEIERHKKQVKRKEDKDQDVGKKKSRKREENGGEKGQKDNHKAIVRLKRYISLCGERRNYKKLLGDCRSVCSMVAVLKKELEDLGVHGQPSIEKCKRLRRKKDEAKELAELDVNNIIETQGRPKRRGAVARHGQRDPVLSTYQRSLNSGSGSDQENDIQRGPRKTDWANLQGIISDDADSD